MRSREVRGGREGGEVVCGWKGHGELGDFFFFFFFSGGMAVGGQRAQGGKKQRREEGDKEHCEEGDERQSVGHPSPAF